MHSIVLITAMSATTGLFGGGKHCGGKVHHCRKATVASCYTASPCGATYAAPHAMMAPSAQSYPTSPQAAPMAPTKAVPAAPTVPPAPPVPTTYLVPTETRTGLLVGEAR